ncbi:MAG: DNA mismatch repair protein MutS [Deltaproteobacteria bacterium]|nr:DNA mismatch repair protein MutS [Deltaproteobacteria bacterium]
MKQNGQKSRSAATPMLRHYLEIKERYPEEILFYRVGDFFEMFYEDALRASKLLDIALTSRDKNSDNPVPLCGVPHHAVNGYISRLVAGGHKVVVCDQVEDARFAQGLVRREVTRVITPGTLLEDEHLEARGNNYLLGLSAGEGRVGLACLDLSTGEFRATEVEDEPAAIEEVARIDPREVLLSQDLASAEGFSARWRVLDGRCVNVIESAAFDPERARLLLCEQFAVQSLDGFGCEGLSPALGAAGALVAYARETQCTAVAHLGRVVPYVLADYMVLDDSTRRNLELTQTLRETRRDGSLLATIDRTVTAMGARALGRWVLYPLLRIDEINRRLDAVEELLGKAAVRESLRDQLARLADLERINARVAAGRATPRDLGAMRASLEALPAILDTVSQLDADYFRKDRFPLDPLPDLAALLAQSIVEAPPAIAREGGVIRPGYNARLDELRDLSGHGKGWIAELEARERARTKISNLKIRYNKVFGYFIEITKSNLQLVPPDYERRQTLANAERYVTPELKDWESKVLTADEEAVALERDLFDEIHGRLRSESGRVQGTAAAIARLDALAALAQVAHAHRYVRPLVDAGGVLTIIEGRHPVIERANLGERFVPNDVHIDGDSQQLLILTGPNMAGKSTVLRQTALIALMAQMGSFVPARSARIGLVDRIFTRVGASDSLSRGHSTFMVEMIEAANILHHATDRSLVILDEIGRGTSTFDGISIAWAIAEFLHDRLGARPLFPTHYHELTDLARTKLRARNFHIAVKEWNGRVIFLRKLVEGGTSRSYGIEVARLAGLPAEVVERAREVLDNLERGELDEWGSPRLAAGHSAPESARAGQLGLFTGPPPPGASSAAAAADRLRDEIASADRDTLSPLEALNLLHRLKRGLAGDDPEEGGGGS